MPNSDIYQDHTNHLHELQIRVPRFNSGRGLHYLATKSDT